MYDIGKDVNMRRQWKEMHGFRGYEVSTLGEIRSYWKRGRGRRGLEKTSHPINPSLADGYRQVTLVGKEKYVTKRAARLVLYTFVGAPPKGRPFVNHKDLNRSNDSLSNLEWVSPAENVQHAWDNGAFPEGYSTNAPRGEAHKNSKLTEAVVIELRRAYFADPAPTLDELAALFGVSNGAISMAIRGKTWAHVPGAIAGPIPSRSGVYVRCGPDSANAKLTPKDARKIKAERENGMSYQKIADAHGVSIATIWRMLNGRSWKSFFQNQTPL